MHPASSQPRPEGRPRDERLVSHRPASRAARSVPGCETARRLARIHKHPRGRVSSHPRRSARHVPHQGAGCQKVEFGFFDNTRYTATKGEDGFWTATTESRRARLPLLPDVDRRRAGERSGEPDVLRHGQGHQLHRSPREGRRLLHAEGRAARRGPRAMVLLEDD